MVSQFVENNKDKCNIIYEDEIYELTEYFKLRQKSNTLKIKLKGIKNINNMSYMFNNCSSLLSLPDISNWNTSNVNYMSYMFNNCSSLTSLRNITNWNINKLKCENKMFEGCKKSLNISSQFKKKKLF